MKAELIINYKFFTINISIKVTEKEEENLSKYIEISIFA